MIIILNNGKPITKEAMEHGVLAQANTPKNVEKQNTEKKNTESKEVKKEKIPTNIKTTVFIIKDLLVR